MTPPAQIDGPEWVRVPREPTQAMCEAGVAAGVKASPEPWCPKTWAAMIAAAPQPKAEGCDALLKELRWRIEDIREMLMSEGIGGQRIYGCDEWSTPTVNLQSAINLIDKARTPPATEGTDNE